jgi:hypothetical protein
VYGDDIFFIISALTANQDDYDSRTIFMFCARYGWIPGPDDVPQEIREKYSWVDDTSMTFMEILHGALR